MIHTNKIIRHILTLIIATTLASCARDENEPTPPQPHYNQHSVSPTAMTLKVGERTTLTVLPPASGGPGIDEWNKEWTTSDPKVAVVNSKGTVEARGVGEAIITIRNKDLNLSATCKVTVPYVKTENLEIYREGQVGSSFELPVERCLLLRAKKFPEGASAPVQWSTSDPEVAAIDTYGRLIAKKLGKVVITATAEGKSKSTNITIVANPQVATDAYRITIVTKDIEEVMAFGYDSVKNSYSDVWLDLNGNGVQDKGEDKINGLLPSRVTPKVPVITIYGSITRLECRYSSLIAIDTSENPDLEVLNCYENQLEELDVSANTALKELRCFNNKLKKLTLNEHLVELDCHQNNLSQLTLNRDLKEANCSANPLTMLDVSASLQLKSLGADNTQLTHLDVSKNTALENLYLGGGKITSIDVSKNQQLKGLSISKTKLTAIDVSHNPQLQKLDLSSNELTTVDVSNNPQLTILRLGDNRLTAIDVSHNPQLTELDVAHNRLTAIDVSHNPELVSLSIVSDRYYSYYYNETSSWTSNIETNRITTFDISKNPKLHDVECFPRDGENLLTPATIQHLVDVLPDHSATSRLVEATLKNAAKYLTSQQAYQLRKKGWKITD